MSIIQDVEQSLKSVASVISSIRTISKAVREGRDYVRTRHPQVAEDLAVMCNELRNTAMALSAASTLITHFRFVGGDGSAASLQAFADALYHQKAKAEEAGRVIGVLRGHCSVIRQHADRIMEEAAPQGLSGLAAVLGLHSEEKERRIAEAIGRVCDVEMEFHMEADQMTRAIRAALEDVGDRLETDGMLDPARMPEAAKLLKAYRGMFTEIDAECLAAAKELAASVDALDSTLG
ncbi:hypothetical protein [Poseidonocella sp. HB161398]|uniref:hypothetical protein n=1 Tax=Poseidonocella sp. HB161398 TaxID=2320855 RepID=UPI0014874E52|nr:hypothetical protein [Poseidonocella sp. HB161398]